MLAEYDIKLLSLTVLASILFIASVTFAILSNKKTRGIKRGVLCATGSCAALLFGYFASSFAFMCFCKSSIVNSIQFDHKNYEGKIGEVKLNVLGSTQISIISFSKKNKIGDSFALDGENGCVKAPAGTYTISSYHINTVNIRKAISAALYRKLEDHANWENNFTGIFIDKDDSPIVNVREGTVQYVDLGPPFEAKLNVSKAGTNSVHMILEIRGRNNEVITLPNASARFQILSQSGKVLKEGKFEYG